MESKEVMVDTDIVEKKTQGFSIEILSSESGFDAISEKWDALVEIADVHIFQTYEWQRTWWKFFGGNNDLHILLFWEYDRLVGIAPLFLDYFRILGMPVYRCLRMLGSRIIQPEEGSVPVELAFSDYLSVIAHPGYEKQVHVELGKYLQANYLLYDEVIFEEAPEKSLLLTTLLPKMEQTGWKPSVKEASACPQILFPESWDDLLSDLSSNARYQIRRDLRRVADDELFELQTARTGEEVKQAFDNLVEFHQRRWHNLRQPGIFADKRILGFFREVAMRFHQKGWLSFKSLAAEGKCIAVDLLFKFKGTLYMIQRGFDDASEYNKYGPGNILLYCVIKEAIEEGFTAYDFLRGEESYKLRTANHIPKNREVILQKRKRKQSVRPKLNELLRKYGHLKRKIHNERHVIGVHFEQQNSFSAFGAYLKEIYSRTAKKVGNLNIKKMNQRHKPQ